MLAAKLRTYIEALHLAYIFLKLVEGNAASGLAAAGGEQQAAVRRCIVAGKRCEFLVEILETQAEAQGIRVFEEEFAGLGDVFRRFGSLKVKSVGRRGSFLVVRFHFFIKSSGESKLLTAEIAEKKRRALRKEILGTYRF